MRALSNLLLWKSCINELDVRSSTCDGVVLILRKKKDENMKDDVALIDPHKKIMYSKSCTKRQRLNEVRVSKISNNAKIGSSFK